MSWCRSLTEREGNALAAIVESAALIAGYLEEAGEDWDQQQHWIDALAKRVEEIGAQAKRITEETLLPIPNVDWRGIKGMRDILAHDYGDVDLAILHEVVSELIPGMRREIQEFLRDRAGPSG